MSGPTDQLSDPRFLAAIELFGRGVLPSGKAADLCGMSRAEFLLAAGRLGVAVIRMDEDELRQELSDTWRG